MHRAASLVEAVRWRLTRTNLPSSLQRLRLFCVAFEQKSTQDPRRQPILRKLTAGGSGRKEHARRI